MNIYEFEIKNRDPQDSYLIPAIIYGHQIKESIACAINKRDFVKLVKTNSRNIIIRCKLENGQAFSALIQEVQKNILTLEPIHVDFFFNRSAETYHHHHPDSFTRSICRCQKQRYSGSSHS